MNKIAPSATCTFADFVDIAREMDCTPDGRILLRAWSAFAPKGNPPSCTYQELVAAITNTPFRDDKIQTICLRVGVYVEQYLPLANDSWQPYKALLLFLRQNGYKSDDSAAIWQALLKFARKIEKLPLKAIPFNLFVKTSQVRTLVEAIDQRSLEARSTNLEMHNRLGRVRAWLDSL